MELTIRPEVFYVSRSYQPKTYEKTSAFSALPQVKQVDFEKTKAESEKQTASEQDILTAIDYANSLMELFNRDLRFETHEETGMLQISVIDKNDGKVIKQIPPDEVLKSIARIRDILGSLVDVKL